jgi:hypothetical protein
MSALQLLSNPVTQVEDAKDGLEYISDLLIRYKVVEITYSLSPTHKSQRYLLQSVE